MPDDSDDNHDPRIGCARGRVRLLHGVSGHYELQIVQTAGPTLSRSLGEAEICMTAGELRALRRAIDAMFPETPERVALDLTAKRGDDQAEPKPQVDP